MMRGALEQIANLPEERAVRSEEVFRRLMAYLKPYTYQLIIILVLVLLGAASQAAGPFLIGYAIDTTITNGDIAGLDRLMIMLLLVYLGGAVTTRYQIALMGEIGQRLLATLRTAIFATIQRLSLRFFDQRPAGDLMSRLTSDTDVLNQLLSQGLVQVLGSLFGILGLLIAMLVLDWRLALASFVVIPLMIILTNVFAGMSRRAFRRARASVGDVSSEIQEDIAAIRVAQAFNQTDATQRRFEQRNAASRDANVNATAVTSAFTPVIDVLATVATAIVAGYGGYLVFQNSITVGTVVAFLTYVQLFFRPIQQLSMFYNTAQASLAAAERIFELIDTPIELSDAPNARTLPTINGDVVFDQVSFGYGQRPGGTQNGAATYVINNLNLHAKPGETIALVGPTGAGKTTLVNLIGRFYDVNEGAVRIDGHDVREVTRASLRSQMGVVLQETFLFSGTVADNIRYGRLDASQTEIEAAAQAANAHEFILRLPEGYETKLGERGGGLSQGQRQLLGFARAVLANPRILVLDEATSSVDTRTEQLIQQALKTLLSNRTSFVIAHRLSTIRDAQQVLVLDQGRIVERGTHDTLLERNGLYAELYRRQFRDEPTAV
jgi:ATP-binding cassette subfamily B protein/subfamily B ATP-binding cassette protein MsbA